MNEHAENQPGEIVEAELSGGLRAAVGSILTEPMPQVHLERAVERACAIDEPSLFRKNTPATRRGVVALWSAFQIRRTAAVAALAAALLLALLVWPKSSQTVWADVVQALRTRN